MDLVGEEHRVAAADHQVVDLEDVVAVVAVVAAVVGAVGAVVLEPKLWLSRT